MSPPRERLVATARTWIGTPFHHQASCRGAGADCLGRGRGVWREALGQTAAVPPYAADWAALPGDDRLRGGLSRTLRPRDPAMAEPGDVLLFRLRPSGIGSHAGLMTAPDRFVHALETAGVVESRLGGFWRSRLVAAFFFPGLD